MGYIGNQIFTGVITSSDSIDAGVTTRGARLEQHLLAADRQVSQHGAAASRSGLGQMRAHRAKLRTMVRSTSL